MSISLTVETKLPAMLRRMKILQKQMPFATSLALNNTGKDVQKAEIANIKRVFKNKKTWWLPQQPTGIKMRRSSKRSLITSVFTNAHFAAIQEKGGTKRPRAGRSIAVPSDLVPKTLRKSGGARKFRNRKTSFVVTLRDGDKAVLRRKGPKKKRTNQLFFFLEKSARIKPRFNFRKVAHRVATRQFPRRMQSAVAQAMRTSKR